MVKSKSALLALIHQHLLKNGYAKAARELQRENGENFATSKITLQRVYKLWTKKSKKKKKKKEEAKHKKRDHDSKKADHLDLALPAKKSSGTKTKKTKQVKKKMNLATEAAADVKVISKKASASLNDNPGSSVTQEADVFPDGNYSSVAASLKSKPGAEKSNGSSSSSETEEETTKQVARGKKNPDPVAAEQKSLSKPFNGKAEVSRSSADSDETDIDKLPALVTSKPTVSSQKASKRKRQAAPPVQTVQADSSTESSETDEEDEPVKQVATPTSKLSSPPAVSAAKLKAQSLLPALQSVKAQSSESDSEEEPVKQDKTPAKAVKASPTKPRKGLGKAATPAQANASAVKIHLHSKMLVSETESDSSDSEEQQKTPSAITSKIATASQLTPLAAVKVGMPIKTELPSEETSEEESSDSDEEPTTKTPATVISTPQLKTFSVGIKQTPVVAAKTPLKSSQPADESSEEESTDSSEEPSVKKPGTVLQASQSKTPVVEAKKTEVAKSKSPSKAPQPASESSEDSDSNEEPVAKKPATVHLSQPKTPSGGAKQASVLAKTQSPAKTTPLADESSEESDSEEESAAKKPATVHLSQPKTPSGGAKQASVLAKTQSPAKTTPLADDESSEEASDSEEESAAKKPTTAVQSSQLKTPSGGAKQTTLKATLKTPLKTAQQDSESSEESDTDEETVAKKPATALQSTQPKSPSGDPKQTAMMAKSKTAEPNSESSDESDSDEEATAKATPAVQVKMSAPDSSVLTVKQTFTVQVPDSDADSESSESSDTEQKQRSKSTAPVKVPKKTPAVVGKVAKSTAADATDSSDSDDEEKAQPKPSAVSRGLKAKRSASTALKPDESSEESESESDEEPVKPAEVKTLETQKEKLSASQPKITAQPSAIVSKGKSLVSSKMTAFSQAMADSSESTESSDNEDLPPAQVPRISVKATPPAAKVTVQPAAVAKHKAGGPTKSVPGTKLAKLEQGTPDGSESSDGEEQPDAQKLELSVEAKQKKKPMSAPLLTSTPYESTVSKGKGAVPASTHPVAKETDISESSDTESDEEETKQVVTPTPSVVKSKSGRITDTLAKTSTSSNPAIAKTATPFKVPSTLKKDPVESSSESSDSESSEETAVKVNTPVPTAVKAAQPKVSEKLKTPNVTNPVPGKPNASSQQKPKQVDTDGSSESSDSEAEPVVKTAVQKVTTPGPTAKKMKQENQSDKVVRTPLAPKLLPSKPTGISVAKTPLQAGEESSSESSDSEEDTAEKPPPATPKHAAQPSVGKTTTQSPAVLHKKQESSSEESNSDEEEPVKKPTAATPKSAAQPTVRKTTTQSPAVLHKKQESSSEESDSDEKEPVKKLTSSFGKTQKKPGPAASLAKLKSPAKSTVVTKSNVSSDTASSDSEEDRPVQDKGAATGNLTSSNKSVERSVGKMSSADVKKIRPAVPSTPSGGSKPNDSQTLLKAFFPVVITTPKKRKKASKTTNKLDSVAGKSKKKEAKNKVQPDIVPVLPMALPEQSPSAVALLESEEETVLALLEGRSPKKAKKNKISKKAAETAVFDFATPLVQNNDVPLKSPLPQPFLSSTWVPESPTSGDDKSVQPTTELPSLSDKKVKSSKKRKISQDLEKQTQKTGKKAKKDEKEKKIQKGMVEEANVTAKPKSDKKKSEKDRSNKKTKTKEKMENKEGKKKAESIAAAVVESADSGIGLSKPKKKRKT